MTDSLKGKKVAVLGFARQGRALARWLPTLGARVLVSDGKTADALQIDVAAYPEVEFVLGGHPPEMLDGVDVLCLSGGVPLDLPIVVQAIERGIPLTNDAQLFLERCPAPVIGITGSAGKTTTTTLTGLIMQESGFRTWVGGNIGDVLLDVLPQIGREDRVVMELSSFQLELMTRSPQVAAVLNITPNHLDRHGTMENYMLAKAHILDHQVYTDGQIDTAVLGWDDGGSHALEERVIGRLCWFSATSMVGNGAFLAGRRLIVTGDSSPDGDPHVIVERDEIPLRGDHNVLNVLAACAISGAAGASLDAMQRVIRSFKGVAHRLEIVRTVDDVTYVNDSIATAPERVTAALNSFTEPLILLLGGRDKKLPWEDMLARAAAACRAIILFGEAGAMIERVIAHGTFALQAVYRVETLDQAVAQARAAAQPGDVVLLSPGGTSYDAYTDFAERGEHFRRLVNAL
ncbi:MAG: UDP-N-acetylmuramoyl-L-alanine--D-glutamate ligase [bacterium]|nr:UDP-N-acetylmuramoyl-L-alanine--D-glutamate ligase [bacterium]